MKENRKYFGKRRKRDSVESVEAQKRTGAGPKEKAQVETSQVQEEETLEAFKCRVLDRIAEVQESLEVEDFNLLGSTLEQEYPHSMEVADIHKYIALQGLAEWIEDS